MNPLWTRWLRRTVAESAAPTIPGSMFAPVGATVDNGSRLTFLQADFVRIATQQKLDAHAASSLMTAVDQAASAVATGLQRSRDAALQAKVTTAAAALSMQAIDGRVQRLASAIDDARSIAAALESRSGQIEQIVQSIDKIARETTLLAMNAKIEAARAGEHGRGFTVVADAVKALSVQTNEATRQVQDLLVQTLADIRRSRETTDQSRSHCVEVARLSRSTSVQMAEVEHGSVGAAHELTQAVDKLERLVADTRATKVRIEGLDSGAGQVEGTAVSARDAARVVLSAALEMQAARIASDERLGASLPTRMLALTEWVRGRTVLALNDDPSGVLRAREAIRPMEDRVRGLAAAARGRPRMDEFLVLWDEYCTLRNEALALAEGGHNDEAVVYTSKKNRPKYQQLRQLLVELAQEAA